MCKTNDLPGSDSETGSATTGAAGIGVFKCKPAVVQPVLPVDLHPEKIQLMCFVHDTIDPGNIEMAVVFLNLVKTQYIGHPGASPALHTDPEFLRSIKALGLHQLADLGYGPIGQLYR